MGRNSYVLFIILVVLFLQGCDGRCAIYCRIKGESFNGIITKKEVVKFPRFVVHEASGRDYLAILLTEYDNYYPLEIGDSVVKNSGSLTFDVYKPDGKLITLHYLSADNPCDSRCP